MSSPFDQHRRPNGRLLFNQGKIGIFDPKILFDSATVKGEFAFGNTLGFQVQTEDLPLKWYILRINPKGTFQEGVTIPHLHRFLLTTHHMMSILDSLEHFGGRT
jgi:hypothetical protein